MESLMQYVRKRRRGQRVKVGVMIARKVSKRVLVGWSKCKLSVDEFDVERGLNIANERIDTYLKEKRKLHEVPASMVEEMEEFQERCKRYFKVKTVKLV